MDCVFYDPCATFTHLDADNSQASVKVEPVTVLMN